MKVRALPVALIAALLLTACGGEDASTPGADGAPGTDLSASRVPLSPTPPVPSPKAWAVSPAQAECEGGWKRPPQDEIDAAVATIQGVTGARGRFKVMDARTFTGPESPPRDVGATGLVTRWYVKGGTPTSEARYLVEDRQFGRGLVAVAPLESEGFTSPDWVGFIFDGSEPATVEGIPGRWVGVRYDFVSGGEGLNLPGLPAAMAACLDGS